MSTTIEAVYRDGVFRPAIRPNLAEGTAVRLTVNATIVIEAPDPRTAHEMIQTILARPYKFNPETDKPEVTSENHDDILYGSPNGAL